MRLSMLRYLLCIDLLFCFITASAQLSFPTNEGERKRYSAYIEMSRGYISGVCILVNEKSIIKGSLFNEFGITALDFSYDPCRKKIHLYSVIAMMDKWYIRRVLKKDLVKLMSCLQHGKYGYRNERQQITYQFTPIADEVTQ